MIEMLGVLAIVGVLSAGGIAGYSMAMQSYKTNALIEKVQVMAIQARKTYKGNYSGMTHTTLYNAGKISDYKNPFGGELHIISASDHFYIYPDSFNLPAEACTDVLMYDYGDKGVFLGFQVNDATDFYYSSGTYPITMAQAISACKGGNKKIDWTFK